MRRRTLLICLIAVDFGRRPGRRPLLALDRLAPLRLAAHGPGPEDQEYGPSSLSIWI